MNVCKYFLPTQLQGPQVFFPLYYPYIFQLVRLVFFVGICFALRLSGNQDHVIHLKELMALVMGIVIWKRRREL